jgi:hypothetical protein
MAYWYNISSGQVEEEEDRSPSANLMGPYDTREEATRALETARERTDAWDEEDRLWEEGNTED